MTGQVGQWLVRWLRGREGGQERTQKEHKLNIRIVWLN